MHTKNIILTILSLVFFTCISLAKRPIEFKDMFAMGRVADPQISPDGNWVAYTVTFYELEGNLKNSDTSHC